MNKKEKKPNFFIIGAPKCGTTAMSNYLASHPQVFFSKPKEIHFFRPDFEMGSWKTGYIRTLNDYLELFKNAENYPAVGEGSAMYMCSPQAIKNIMEFNPDAKLIAMIRNPVDMFHSYFWELRLSGYKENAKSPEEAWYLQEERKRGKYIPRKKRGGGEYKLQYGEICSLGHQLEQIYEIVPAEQVHVIFFDDLKNNPRRVYEEALAFLGLEPDEKKEFTPKNTRASRSSSLLTLVHQKMFKLKKQAGIKGGAGILKAISDIEKKISQKKHLQPLRPEFKRELINYFYNDIKKLERLEERDLSHWLEV